MKKEELEGLMTSNLEYAKRLLVRDGKVIPVAFMVYGNDIDIIGLSFRDEDEKVIQIKMLRELVKEKNADAVFIITESWHVCTNNAEDLFIKPSDNPMRKECIFVTGECENTRISMILSFERENDKIIFGERIDTDGLETTRLNFGIKDKKYDISKISLN